MPHTNNLNKDILISGESILAKTEDGHSLRIIVENNFIRIIAVDYKAFYIEPHDANSFCIRLNK
jgi:hypothetical protein